MDKDSPQSAVEPKKATCDMEVWVTARIATAIRMAQMITMAEKVGADETLGRYARYGLIEGAAVEIIRILGLEPEFTNIREIPHK